MNLGPSAMGAPGDMGDALTAPAHPGASTGSSASEGQANLGDPVGPGGPADSSAPVLAGDPADAPDGSRPTDPPADLDAPVDSPDGITARALSIGIAVGAYAISFGAVSIAAGLDVLQTQALSALMFTGASQFAFVGVVAAGGGVVAAVVTAWLLGLRNGLYALHLASVLSPAGHPTRRLRGWRRMGAAQFTIDESTAMALAYEGDPAATRRAFWATGWSVFVLWNLGTLLGAVGAASLSDPKVLGLDAAIPAGFLALLWPRLVDRSAWALAVASAALALVLAPVLRPGMPVLAGAGLAVAGALWLTRERA